MPITINGTTGIAGVDGSSSTPAVQGADTNTGMFFPAADTIAFTAGGTEEFRIGSAGQLGIQGANYGTSGQVFTSGGSGAAPSWQLSGGMTLLGTISTASGSNPTLSGLTLTSYKNLLLVLQGVSGSSDATFLLGTSTADDVAISGTVGLASTIRGFLWLDLTNGTFAITSVNVGTSASASAVSFVGDTTITTASTVVSLAVSTGAFDAGSVLVYGVK